MMRKFYAFLILFTIALTGSLYAQTGAGELRGKVVDSKTKEGIPFAGVIVESNGTQVGSAPTDFDGNYVIKPITPGKYDVRVRIIGYNDRLINNVIITANKQTYLNPDLVTSVTNLGMVTITEYAKPLIEQDNTSVGGTLDAAEIVKLPTRDLNSLVSTTAGVYQGDEGDALSIKGSRTDANDIYIDGVKVRGASKLPQNTLGQVTVITGGVPAQYGDATGGIISVTTKGPSSTFMGGVEGATSEFLDGYGYNLLSANLSGPLLLKDKGTENQRSLIGFMVSGELETRRDQNPSYIGAWKADDATLSNMQNAPFFYTYAGEGAGRFVDRRFANGELVRNENLVKSKAQDDNQDRNFSFNSRIDFQPTLNSVFAVGFSGAARNDRVYSRANMLFNSGNNQEAIQNTYRVFARYTQKFNQEEGALLKNAYYTIQGDYTHVKTIQQDINHKDNFFNYGHVGKFTTTRAQGGVIGLQTPITGSDGNTYNFTNAGNGTRDVAFDFQGGSLNPYLVNHNNNLINFMQDNDIQYSNFSSFSANYGLLNGQTPLAVFGGLFRAPGAVQNIYDEIHSNQYRVTAMASADIKNHSIQVGLEYEQRVESRFTINPLGLWPLMRSQQNVYIGLDRSAIDPLTGILDVNAPGVSVSGDTVRFSTLDSYVGTQATSFARNIRSQMGVSPGTLIDIDSYDPSTFGLDMFDASNLLDLLNPAGITYNYYGYNFNGKKSSANPSFEDFFTDTVNRPVGSFRPIYVAGYIQDKFTFRDIIFNLGLRIDRFDANQQVLKDRYSIYELRNAGQLMAGIKPSNIPDDAAVYVEDVSDPNPTNSTVRGYRVGDTFYDASGNPVQDIEAISSAGLRPWLASSAIDGNGRPTMTSGAFKDYEPQTQIMPRIAFSFPISDEANFFANYDVLTQRPRSNVFSNPINYYMQSLGKQSIVIVSPDIKPEKTINYQFGFKQRIGNTSALTMTAFYRELKDNFQQVVVNGAYPANYLTYTNRDFGTVKGLTLQYDLRRSNNISVNAAYTLQFANGTGSNSNSAANLISSGSTEPIRVVMPLDNDQRHTLVTTVDYRYGAGSNYNGPAALRGVLENFGANFIFRAGSGTPYSRISQQLVQDVLRAGDTRFRRLVGEINGSRLPWQFKVDVRFDKDFTLTSKSEDGSGRNSSLNVYLLIQNALNARIVSSVYPATGLPDDDGYLASPQSDAYKAEVSALDLQSYLDQYRIRVNDPLNYRLPRVIRLGAIYNF